MPTLPTERECHEAMGEMIFSFQRLEALWHQHLFMLGDLSNRTLHMIVTDKLSFKDILDAVGATAKERKLPSSVMGKLKTSLKRATRFSEERNKYVHSHYQRYRIADSDKRWFRRQTHRVSRNKGITFDREPYSPAKLRKLSLEINEEAKVLRELFMEITKHVLPHKDYQS